MQGQKQERGNKSFYLPEKYGKMMSILVKRGFYKNKSDLIRSCIEKEYAEKIKDPREELRKEKARLESVIKELESLSVMNEKALSDILRKYSDRRNNMPVKSMGNYEQLSKNWIERNMDELVEIFPNKKVDEIFEELEKLVEAEEEE